MNKVGFKSYFENSTYIQNGKECKYTENAINSRIARLQECEAHYNINIDDIADDYKQVIALLKQIRKDRLEDPLHEPISNAVRHYFTYKTGMEIGRIL